MAALRYVSPERRWRALSLVLLAGLLAWRAFRYAGPVRYLGPVTGVAVPAVVLGLAVAALRTCLVVSDAGLADRRALRTVRVPWAQVTGFRVARPGGLWGGFCVIAECRGGADVDLLSTRAYSRIASQRHLDDLYRLCWTLEERLAGRSRGAGEEP